MKIHTPIFVLGLLVFVTPFLGFTSNLMTIVVAAYGIAIMIISSTINKLPNEIFLDEEYVESKGDNDDVEGEDGTEEPTYEELKEMVQEESALDEDDEISEIEGGGEDEDDITENEEEI